MARNIEERGVKMTFDNAGFERQISATMSSLEALKQKLSLTGASEGVQAVQAEMDKFNVNGITAGIEGVSRGFLALSTVAITALSNITTKAIDTGTQIARSLSVEPILDGFREYEINMNSIQTILANTRKDGTTLTDVNAALDELNEYSDLTIYNFAQMTKNIGSATAAGVDLDTSVQYVKGFANSAAVAGVGANEMAGAMIQMSQALGAGTIKAQDWISLERRGLATQATQEAFFETAKAMGTLADVPIDQSFEDWQAAGNTLRGSLASGWLTADVFLNTMKVFTGEMDEAALAAMGFGENAIPAMLELGQVGVESATKVRTLTQLFDTAQESVASGWSGTFRIIFGDFEQATELFSGLSEAFGDAVGAQAEARNQLLSEWSEGGGREDLIQGLTDGFHGLKNIVDGVREAFREIFPKKTSDDLIRITENFADLMKRFRDATEKGLPTIKTIFKGFFATLSIGFEIFKQAAKLVGGFIKVLFGLGSGAAINPLKRLAEFMIRLRETLVEEGGIARFFEKLGEAVTSAARKIREITAAVAKFIDELIGRIDFSKIGDFFKNVYENIFGGISLVFKGGEKGVKQAGKSLEKAVSTGEKVGNTIAKVWGGIVGVVKTVGQAIGNAFSRVRDIVGSATGGIADILSGGAEIISNAFGAIKDAIGGIGGGIDLKTVAAVGGAAGIGGIFTQLRNIAKNGLEIDFGFGSALEEVTNHLKVMQQKVKSEMLKNIAISIALLAGSIVLLSFVDGGEIAKSLAAMTASLAGLISAFAIINKLDIGPGMTAKVLAIGATLILLAGALVIMGIATKFFGAMDMEELSKGLVGVGAGLVVLIEGVNKIAVNTKGMITAGIALVIISGALALLAVPVYLLGKMNWVELGQGLVGVGAGLAALIAGVNTLPSNTKQRVAGIVGLAIGLTLLVIPIKLLSMMSLAELATGIVAMGSALLSIGLALRAFPSNQAKIGGELLLFSVAIGILAVSIKKLGSLALPTILKGVLTIATVMLVLSGALRLMEGTEKGAFGFITLVFGLQKLADVIQVFNSLGFGAVAVGLLLMLGALAAVAGVAYLLAPAAVPMMMFGAALALLGAAMFLAGAGMAFFSTGLATLVAVGAAGSAALIKSIKAIIDVVPYLAKAAALFLLEFAAAMAEGIPMLIEILVELVTALLGAIQELAPTIIDTVVVVIGELLEGIRELIPQFVETAWSIILAFIQGIRDNIGELTTLAVDIVLEFINAMVDKIPEIAQAGTDYIIALIRGIQESISDIITAGVEAVLAFVQGIADNIILVVDKGFEIVISFINGLAETIRNRRGELADAGLNLVDAILGGIVDKALDVWAWAAALPGTFLEKIGNVGRTLYTKGREIITGLYTGLRERLEGVILWFQSLATRIVNWVVDLPGSLFQIGKDIMNGLWNGMKDVWNDVTGWLSGLNPANWKGPPERDAVMLVENGQLIMGGLLKGMQTGWDQNKLWLGRLNPADELNDKSMTESLYSAMSTAVQQALDAVNNDVDLNPTITPVLDLSNVKAGTSQIAGMLSSGFQYAQAASIARTRINQDDASTASNGGSVNFYQTINAPDELSASDIYRQTRTQIQIAREELTIP